jgi:hypothetical protein
VELSLTDFVVIAVLVAVGCSLSFVGLWFMLRLLVSELQKKTESQLNSLADALKTLEARSAVIGVVPELQGVAAPVVELDTALSGVKETAYREVEEVSSETLVVIAAAVTAFLGKKVRIRSAKMLRSPREGVSPWSQQGRALVQASHHLR